MHSIICQHGFPREQIMPAVTSIYSEIRCLPDRQGSTHSALLTYQTPLKYRPTRNRLLPVGEGDRGPRKEGERRAIEKNDFASGRQGSCVWRSAGTPVRSVYCLARLPPATTTLAYHRQYPTGSIVNRKKSQEWVPTAGLEDDPERRAVRCVDHHQKHEVIPVPRLRSTAADPIRTKRPRWSRSWEHNRTRHKVAHSP